jgi:hypothetical protein
MKEVLRNQLTEAVQISWNHEAHTTHSAQEAYVTMQTAERSTNVTPIIPETK